MIEEGYFLLLPAISCLSVANEGGVRVHCITHLRLNEVKYIFGLTTNLLKVTSVLNQWKEWNLNLCQPCDTGSLLYS